MTNELLEESKDNDLALKRAKQTKSQEHWLEARTMRNTCLSNIGRAKADFICEKLEENRSDSKKFWNTINYILPGKGESCSEIFLKKRG